MKPPIDSYGIPLKTHIQNSIFQNPQTHPVRNRLFACTVRRVLAFAGILFSLGLNAQTPEPVAIDASVVADSTLGGAHRELLETVLRQQWRSAKSDPGLNQRQRIFDAQKLAEYRADSDYQYDRLSPPETMSWWQRLKSWLRELLGSTLFRKGSGSFWETFAWIVAGILIVYAILKFVGADPRSLFARKPQSGNLSLDEEEANIHAISFDDMIAEAIAKQQYKRAVRLFYLKSLKQLSDREWIDWRPYKTNYEYVRELKKNELDTDFKQVTYLFENVWYGDFQLNQASFQETERQFKDFERRINTF